MLMTESSPVRSGTRSIGWSVEFLNFGTNPLQVTATAVYVP